MPHALDKYCHGETPYAFVTGSTKGIGRALAFELASMKFNLVLHSRSLDKLKTVQQEILTRYPGIQVVCIAHDASKTVSNWNKLLEPVNNIHITVLINNLGVNVSPYNSFERQTDEQIEESIRVNNIFPTQLTKHILPILVVNSPALILNIGSGAELAPPPLLTVYSAAKSYVRTWSTGLRNELRLLGRDVECKLVMTSGVTSGLNRPETLFRPSAEHYARSLLARAGSSGPVYNGYWGHTLKFMTMSLVSWLPESVMDNRMKKLATDIVRWSKGAGADDVISLSEFR